MRDPTLVLVAVLMPAVDATHAEDDGRPPKLDRRAVARREAAHVLLDAAAREVVEKHDAVPIGEQALGDVRADESRAAGDQDVPARGPHRARPRRASPAAALSTRSY